jgi:hypothetical protein
MARRRMIDPNFWQSEDVSKLTIRQRLLLIGLFSNADDEGKLRGNPAFVRSLVFPYEDISISDIEEDLEVIENIASIMQYEVEGNKYIKLINWTKFQRVDKPQKSMIPEPNNHSENDSKNESENGYRLKERKGKERNIEEKGKEESSSDPAEKLKDELHKLINKCKIQKMNLHSLDLLFSYIGMVDKEIIEAAIKKGEGKHFNYVLNTLEGMYKEGITKKEHLYQKPTLGKPIKQDKLPEWIETKHEPIKPKDLTDTEKRKIMEERLKKLGEWEEVGDG